MTSLQIKIYLLKQGLSVSQLARDLGERRDMVSHQIHGHYDYPRLRRRLRDEYGIICPPLRRPQTEKKTT